MRKFVVLLAVSSLFSALAFAGSDTSPNAGSDACGLGWQVTKSKSLIGTTTRGTTNYVLPYTFSITSGTSGCDSHTFTKNEMEGVRYAATNLEPLTVEMASGSGEYVAGLAKVMGCGDNVVENFGQMTQKNYKSIVGSENRSGYDVFVRVRAEIQKDPVLAVSCGNAV